MIESIDAHPEACARAVLETVPAVMRFIRAEMRRHRGSALSVPQFRSLAYVERNPEASLGEVAAHLGLTAASTSVLVEGLVARRLLRRAASTADRRRLTLALTASGAKLLASARGAAQSRLATALAGLASADRRTILMAMVALRQSFAQAQGQDEGKDALAWQWSKR
jgi:DNA-binding MarR family transcriptional regulator